MADSWDDLKKFTAARIAIGRVGNSIPLQQSLQLKLAHAHARDAIYSVLEIDALTEQLKAFNIPILHVHSQAGNRQQYLQRPDLGRKLDDASIQLLADQAEPADVCFIIADGLSADAVNTHACGLLSELLPMLKGSFTVVPLCLAEQARVAIADAVAHTLKAKLSIILIGERPGLSAADSVGAYLTYNPQPGLTDEARNCVSNIRPEGLPLKPAAEKIFYLIREAFRRKLSGVQLKDNAGLLPG